MKVDDSGFFKYKKYMLCWYESRLTCDKYEYSLYDSRLFNCLTVDHLSSSCMEADWSFTHFSHQKDHSPSYCLKLDNSLPFFSDKPDQFFSSCMKEDHYCVKVDNSTGINTNSRYLIVQIVLVWSRCFTCMKVDYSLCSCLKAGFRSRGWNSKHKPNYDWPDNVHGRNQNSTLIIIIK